MFSAKENQAVQPCVCSFLQTNLDFEVLIKISLKEELNMSKSKPMIHH